MARSTEKPNKSEDVSILPAALLTAYIIFLALSVFGSNIFINSALTIVHLSVLQLTNKLDPKPLKRLIPFLTIILFVSALFAGSRNNLGFTTSGLMIGLTALSAYLAIFSAVNLFQLEPVNRSFINIAKRHNLFTPLLLSYNYLFMNEKVTARRHKRTKAQESNILSRFKVVTAQIRKGVFTEKINRNIETKITELESFTKENGIKNVKKGTIYIASIAILLTTLRAFRLIPGIPVVPGHKLLITLPLYYLTSVKLGGFSATITAWTFSTLSLLLGLFGQLAVIDFVRLILLGFIVDLSVRLLPKNRKLQLVTLITFGAIEGLIFAYLGVVFFILLQVPKVLYIFSAHKFLFNTVFGALSGVVTYFLLSQNQKLNKIQNSR